MLYNLHNVLQLYKEYVFFGILISSVICQAAIDQPLQLHKQTGCVRNAEILRGA